MLTPQVLIPAALAWAGAHAWCHARCAALRRGDLEALRDPGAAPGLARALADGARIGTVAPDVARIAVDSGLDLPDGFLRACTSGRARRMHDRTLAADLPWLPAYVAAVAAGLAASPAHAALLALAAWSAQADLRFRVVPVPAAAGLVALSAAVTPLPPAAAAIAAAALLLSLALGMRLARRLGRAFGSGDVVLLLTAPLTLGPAGTPLFSVLLLAGLAARWAVARARGEGPVDVPLAAYTAAPLAISVIAL